MWNRSARLILVGFIAVAFFWVAYDDGSYGVAARGTMAVAVWWAIVLILAFRLVTVRSYPRAAVTAGGLLTALALWTLASAGWAPSAEEVLSEFNRVTLYLGVFALTILVARRRDVGRWCDALALAIVAVALAALVSRLFSGVLADRGLSTLLPSSATRLSFPLGYWNGLAVFVALGVPLLLRLALVARTALGRGLALAPMPILAAAIYLTSSRGGALTALVGALVFIALAERRWNAIAALTISLIAAAGAVAILVPRTALVNGLLETGAARSEGRMASILLALLCVATAVIWGFASGALGERFRPPRWAGVTLAAAPVAAVLAALVLVHPVARFEEFKRLPENPTSVESGDFVRAHLLSGNGSGRWQFWTVALEAWTQHPLQGLGAGSYEHWWAEHASFSYFVRDAHSLYLEILAELGVVGLMLVLALLVTGVVGGCRRALGATGAERMSIAALTAALVGYCFAAGIDWMWELTAVSLLGVVTLALVTGPATETLVGLREVVPGEAQPWFMRYSVGVGFVVVAVAWIVISAQALDLLSQRAIARSEAAARAGDLAGAVDEAIVAQEIEPWAATAYLQLALVEERKGDLRSALAHIDDAISRSPQDWRLWLVAARIETKLGHVSSAEIRLRRAVALNPRSPLFAVLLEQSASG